MEGEFVSKKEADTGRNPNACDASSTENDARSPYEAPAITWVEVFDKEATLAAACGKVYQAQGGPCAVSPGS